MRDWVTNSITGDKSRYNDDFYLNFDGTDKYLEANDTFDLIKDINDWSISFFAYASTNSDTKCVVDTRFGLSDNINGITIDLQNAGVDFHSIRFGTGIGTGRFTYEFTQAKLYINSWNHVCLVFDNATNNLRCYVNSKIVETSVGNPQLLNIANPINNSGVTKARYGKSIDVIPLQMIGGFKDFTVFDKQLTQGEITYIYQTTAITSNTCINCYRHYTFNNIARINGGNREMLDVVANYNWAKTTNVTPKHGILLGFTDEELGIGINGLQDGTVYKDFYNKDTYRNIGLVFKNTSFNFTNKNLSTEILSGDWTINFFINPIKRPYTQHMIFSKGISNSSLLAIRGTPAGTFSQVINYSLIYSKLPTGIGSNQVFDLFSYGDVDLFSSQTTFIKQIKCTVVCISNVLYSYLNGKLINTQPFLGFADNTLGTNFSIFQRNDTTEKSKDVAINHLSILKTGLTYDNIRKLHFENLYNILTNKSCEYYPSFSTSKIIKDFSGNGYDITYSDSISYDIEFKSNKPPIKYGIQFNTGKSLSIANFNPTSERGYTILVAFAMNSNSNFASSVSFFRKQESSIKRIDIYNYPTREFRLYAPTIQLTDVSADFSKPFLLTSKISKIDNVYEKSGKFGGSYTFNTGLYQSTASNMTFGFDEILATTTIGLNVLGIGLYIAVYKGILDDEEIKRLYNNGLFANAWDISPNTNSELVLFPDFNNPFDDAGTLKIPDLSPSNHTIVANGWANLATIQASRVDIKSLI